MSTKKFLNSSTVNLSEQDNEKTALQWAVAGRLNGLSITDVSVAGSNLGITLSPGAFIHNGIIVKELAEKTVTVAGLSSYPTNEDVYLVAQSNGNKNTAAPVYSLIRKTVFDAQPSGKNYAAVIAIYKLLQPQGDSAPPRRVLFTNDITTGWTPSGSFSPETHSRILNADPTIPTGNFLTGSNTNVDVVAIGDLPATQVASVQKLNLFFYGRANPATASASVKRVSISYVANTVGTLSVFLNGVGVSIPYNTTTQADTTILQNLWTTLISNSQILGVIGVGATHSVSGTGVIASTGSATLDITTSIVGQPANYTLSAFSTPASGTLTVGTSTITPAVQDYFKASLQTSVPTVIAGPFNVYPIVDSAFGVTALQVDLGNLDVVVFNDLRLKLEVFATPVTGFVKLTRTDVFAYFTEQNFGIDLIPPTSLIHWSPGRSVAVGEIGLDPSNSTEAGLAAHRASFPVDHLDRSIDRSKIGFGAVGVQEVDPGIIGDFSAHQHAANDNTLPPSGTPWSVVHDFNLKELSDLTKSIADGTFGTLGLFNLFSRDHDSTSTGRHKSVKYAQFATPPGTPATDGTVVSQMLSEDSDLTPITDVTGSQMFMEGSIVAKSAALYTRLATMGSLGQIDSFGITSNSLANEATETGFEISMDKDTKIARFGITSSGAYDVYGVRKLDGIAVSDFVTRNRTLFSGAVGFIRTDANSYNTRVVSGKVYSDEDTFFNSTADSAGNLSSKTSSYNTNPGGYMVFYRGGRSLFPSGGDVTSSTSMWCPNASGTGANNIPPAATPQYLYLPFTVGSTNPYSKIIINLSGIVRSYSAGTQASNLSVTAYPAYDAKDILTIFSTYQVTAVTNGSAGASPNTDIYGVDSGIVRRFPWVLTPSGYERNVGVYYNNANFLSTPPSRSVTFGAGAVSSTAPFTVNPLPYYDKLSAGDTTNAKGVVFSLAQGSLATAMIHKESVLGSFYDNASITLNLDMKNESAVFHFITVNATTVTPTGIVICLSNLDVGLGANYASGPFTSFTGPISISVVGVPEVGSDGYSIVVP